MKKLLAAILVSVLTLSGTAYAGILNGSETIPRVQELVDNAKETKNYFAGTFLSHNEETGLEYYGISLYDFTYRADAESEIPIAGWSLGYAGRNKAVTGLFFHVDDALRSGVQRVPVIADLGITIPEKLVFNVGYAAAYSDADEWDYGPTFSISGDF